MYLSAAWIGGDGHSLKCCFLHAHGPGLALKGAEDFPLLLHLTVHTGAGRGPPPHPSLAVEGGATHQYTPIAGAEGSACVYGYVTVSISSYKSNHCTRPHTMLCVVHLIMASGSVLLHTTSPTQHVF